MLLCSLQHFITALTHTRGQRWLLLCSFSLAGKQRPVRAAQLEILESKEEAIDHMTSRELLPHTSLWKFCLLLMIFSVHFNINVTVKCTLET